MTQSLTGKISTILAREIADALDESFMVNHVEISEIETQGETYIITGNFRITPLFWTIPKKKGTFSSKLDKNLKLLSLKIQEET